VELLLILAVVAIAVLVLAAPLRGRHVRAVAVSTRREELEAARDAKYAEIRDAELDFRTGKLSEADWRAIDRELRAEAMELLRAIDEA
jgi:hypothetical protein